MTARRDERRTQEKHDDDDDVIVRLERVASHLEEVVEEAKLVLNYARDEHQERRHRWSGIERRLEDLGHDEERRGTDGG